MTSNNFPIRSNAFQKYREERISHWDQIAIKLDHWKGMAGYYHKRLSEVYRFLVAPGQDILEIGCGLGNLLASLDPSFGVGFDFSSEMIRRAKKNHPDIHFVLCDGHELGIDHQFDVIILSDLVNDVWDVQEIFRQIFPLCAKSTRIIINTYSRLWELPLGIASFLDLAKPVLNQNWLTEADVVNLLHLENMEVVRSWSEIIFPLELPVITPFLNRFVCKIFPFHFFTLSNFILARPASSLYSSFSDSTVSIIVPARNEAGNINQVFDRTPEMGLGTELVFVEGHSIDDTYGTIEKAIEDNPLRRCKLIRQIGIGKGDAVRAGFSAASGDIVMILDADLTVAPEDLLRFYQALVENKGELINGVRLVYPMQKQAMRFLNLIGNKFFSVTFSWIIGQPIKDTLCGTKVLWRKDYLRIASNRSYYGDFDPFGDYDLIFGATRLGLKIVDLPIRYLERTYGKTNIHRWKHGWLLMKMVLFSARKIKFI